MKFREVDRLLRSNGWILVRINGSHHQYKNSGVNFVATVPNHSGKDISIGVMESLEKGTGLSLVKR